MRILPPRWAASTSSRNASTWLSGRAAMASSTRCRWYSSPWSTSRARTAYCHLSATLLMTARVADGTARLRVYNDSPWNPAEVDVPLQGATRCVQHTDAAGPTVDHEHTPCSFIHGQSEGSGAQGHRAQPPAIVGVEHRHGVGGQTD